MIYMKLFIYNNYLFIDYYLYYSLSNMVLAPFNTRIWGEQKNKPP